MNASIAIHLQGFVLALLQEDLLVERLDLLALALFHLLTLLVLLSYGLFELVDGLVALLYRALQHFDLVLPLKDVAFQSDGDLLQLLDLLVFVLHFYRHCLYLCVILLAFGLQRCLCILQVFIILAQKVCFLLCSLQVKLQVIHFLCSCCVLLLDIDYFCLSFFQSVLELQCLPLQLLTVSSLCRLMN